MALMLGSRSFGVAEAAGSLSVIGPIAPDPAPPGYASYGGELVTAWQVRNDVSINYEGIDWPRLHDRIQIDLDDQVSIYDVLYMAGWGQEFSSGLQPLDDLLSNALRSDIAPSSLETHRWQNDLYACPTTLSLLTLYGDQARLDAAGIPSLPESWDELKRIAAELTGDGRYGFGANYGTPGGIGGAASYWFAFLQQAGGTMYAEDGAPAFNDTPGVDALQLMIDLMPSTHPASISDLAISDATNRLISGETAFMMNWPFMARTLRNRLPAGVAMSTLPKGPAGTASIDGGDAWAIAKSSTRAALGATFLELLCDKTTQRQQALETDWLPIRLSVLEEPEIRDALPHAAVVRAQAANPFSSFLTPDYEAITGAVGREVQQALSGAKTAAQAVADASDAVSAIVLQRSND